LLSGCGKSINEQIESNSQRFSPSIISKVSCGKSINEQIESNSQQMRGMVKFDERCGKSINEQIESNSQHPIISSFITFAVAKVSMNKLKAIHNGDIADVPSNLAVAKVSMNKLKAIHNRRLQLACRRGLWQKYQ